MQPQTLFVFYDNGDITSKLIKDETFGQTYNGGHKMVVYGSHVEEYPEFHRVEERGIYYESTIEDLFFKNNKNIAKFRNDWNKEHDIDKYINDVLANSLKRIGKDSSNKEILNEEERKELLKILENNKVHIEVNNVIQLLLLDYLRRNK